MHRAALGPPQRPRCLEVSRTDSTVRAMPTVIKKEPIAAALPPCCCCCCCGLLPALYSIILDPLGTVVFDLEGLPCGTRQADLVDEDVGAEGD